MAYRMIERPGGHFHIASPDRIYISAILSEVLSKPSSSPHSEHLFRKPHAIEETPCNSPVRNLALELNT